MTLENGQKVTVPVRFVASVGHNNDWAMYMGWSNWSDGQIAAEGGKVREGTARAIIQETGSLIGAVNSQDFLERSYRR